MGLTHILHTVVDRRHVIRGSDVLRHTSLLNLYFSRVLCSARDRTDLANFPHRLITSLDTGDCIIDGMYKNETAERKRTIVHHRACSRGP